MTCRKAKARLGRYLDGELSGYEEILLKRHLRECRVCAQESEKLREIGNLLQVSVAPPPPAGLVQDILARVRTESVQVGRPAYLGAWWVWSVPMRFAAAGVALAAVCAGLAVSNTGAPAPDVSELALLQTRPPLVAAYRGTAQ